MPRLSSLSRNPENDMEMLQYLQEQNQQSQQQPSRLVDMPNKLPSLSQFSNKMASMQGYSPSVMDYLKRLQLSGSLSTLSEGPLNLTMGGGRIGYQQPIDNGSFGMGLRGGGAIGRYGDYPIDNLRMSGLDANYSRGNNTYSMDYESIPMEEPNKFDNTLRFNWEGKF